MNKSFLLRRCFTHSVEEPIVNTTLVTSRLFTIDIPGTPSISTSLLTVTTDNSSTDSSSSNAITTTTDDQTTTTPFKPMPDFLWLDVFTQAVTPWFSLPAKQLLSEQKFPSHEGKTLEFTYSSVDGKVKSQVQLYEPAIDPKFSFQVEHLVAGMLEALQNWAAGKLGAWREASAMISVGIGDAVYDMANLYIYFADGQGGSGNPVAIAV